MHSGQATLPTSARCPLGCGRRSWRREKAARQLAAHLIETRRIKEADLIVRDAEQQLADNGIVVGTVVAAFDLSSAMQSALQTMVKKKLAPVRSPSSIAPIHQYLAALPLIYLASSSTARSRPI